MKQNNKLKSQVSIELAILIIIGIFVLLQWLMKEQFLNTIYPLLNIITWFFMLTISAMIPGIIYEGGKGWSKILGEGIITTKEKGFVFYLLNLILIFSLVLFFGLFLNWVLHFLVKYLILIFVEWIIIVYIWFCIYHEYRFPWSYTIITNSILIFYAIIIYKFI